MNKQNGIYKKPAEFAQNKSLSQKLYEDAEYGRRLLGFITSTGNVSIEEFSGAAGIGRFRMVLISTMKARDYTDLYFIKCAASRYIDNVILSEIAGKNIVAVSAAADGDKPSNELALLRNVLDSKLTYKPDIVYSKTLEFSTLPDVYERLVKKVEYAFYCNSQSVYSEEELSGCGVAVKHEYEGLGSALKCGDAINVKAILESFFEELKREKPDPNEARLSCYQLYACVISYCPKDMLESYMTQISKFSRFTNIYEIEKFITAMAMEIVSENDPHNEKSYSVLIKDTVRIINENIGNENLSLRWLAGTILFTNVDYLGKLFKKETGKNFSYYVMEKRMELAKTMMVKKDRVYEVAQKVGYGSNSQYFSHVFKKYTGISPLEYKEFARANKTGEQ